MANKLYFFTVLILLFLISQSLLNNDKLSHDFYNLVPINSKSEIRENVKIKDKIPTKEKVSTKEKIKLPTKEGSLKDAVKIMGDNLSLPSCIQREFNLVKVEIPEDENNRETGIMLKYQYANNDEISFVLRVKEMKNINEPSYNAEKLDILSTEVYSVCYETKYSGKYNATLNFIHKDLKYSLVANRIEKDIIFELVESILSNNGKIQ